MSDSDTRHINLSARLLVYTHTVKDLLSQIKQIENDNVTDPNEKLSKIKMIREEINKVGIEIDNLKKEITMLRAYNVN